MSIDEERCIALEPLESVRGSSNCKATAGGAGGAGRIAESAGPMEVVPNDVHESDVPSGADADAWLDDLKLPEGIGALDD